MESMSNVPYCLTRGDTPNGGVPLKDGLVADGLTYVYKFYMVKCGENTAKKLGITGQEQDEYGMNIYKKAASAYVLIEVEVKGKRGLCNLG